MENVLAIDEIPLVNTFQPNDSSFEDGLLVIEEAYKKVGFIPDGKIMTSKDEIAEKLKSALYGVKTPDGFDKWMLPFSLPGATFFVTVGQPFAIVPPHAHKKGSGVKFIVSGSILYGNKELTSGDWMYVPQGAEYSFNVGPAGVTIISGYKDCCSGPPIRP